MTTEAAPAPRTITFRPGWIVAAVVAALLALNTALAGVGAFPAEWDVGLADLIDRARTWVIQNQRSHPLFAVVFGPISDVLGWGLDTLRDALLATPWFALVLGVALIAARARGLRAALLAVLAMAYFAVFGLWRESIETLALMGVSVAVALGIGIPVGIVAAKRPGFERAIRPLLDTMQTMPAFVYLIPVILFFGIAEVPAAVATIVYAMPAAIRLTTLGLRQVPVESIEASRVFGATPRQTLLKVELPLAMPAILTAVNQTVVLALGIVVIASMIGAAGLGLVVLQSLQQLNVGIGLEAGIGIVILALLLDRIGRGFAERSRRRHAEFRLLPAGWQRHRRARRFEAWVAGTAGRIRRANEALVARLAAPLGGGVREAALAEPGLVAGALLLVLVVLAGLAAGIHEFPPELSTSFAGPVNAAVVWARDNLRGITTALSDALVLYGTVPLRELFATALAWPVVLGLVGTLAWWAAGWRVAVGSVAGLVLVGLLGTWAETMDTLSQVLVAVAIALAIALPLGVLASRSTTLDRVLEPLYDAFMTIPSFVFLVPAVMLFRAGRIPGIIASVIYAFPPGGRITTLGLRLVPRAAVEASEMSGASPGQTLRKVQVPLALPTIMAGVNQVVMLTLAMVVIAGLVGGEGLGLMTVRGFRRQQDLGLGFEGGISIVVLAMILDRITQGWGERLRPPSAGSGSV